MMYCAECGSKMERHAHGAWVGCCNRIGYWYAEGPTKEDERQYGTPNMFHIVNWSSQNAIPIWFYPTAKWPAGKQPMPPLDVSSH